MCVCRKEGNVLKHRYIKTLGVGGSGNIAALILTRVTYDRLHGPPVLHSREEIMYKLYIYQGKVRPSSPGYHCAVQHSRKLWRILFLLFNYSGPSVIRTQIIRIPPVFRTSFGLSQPRYSNFNYYYNTLFLLC
jgi:hypothetical protein